MGAPGFDAHVHQRKLSELRRDALADLVVRHRDSASAAARRHASASHGVAADGGVDSSLILRGPAVHQGDVALLHLTAGELVRQLAMRRVVLGDDDQPTGFLVETMHYPRPQFSTNS